MVKLWGMSSVEKLMWTRSFCVDPNFGPELPETWKRVLSRDDVEVSTALRREDDAGADRAGERDADHRESPPES